jgi:hypothetical protein
LAQGEGTAKDERASIPLYGIGPSIAARWIFAEHAFFGAGIVSRFYLLRPELVILDLSERRRVESASVVGEIGGGLRW